MSRRRPAGAAVRGLPHSGGMTPHLAAIASVPLPFASLLDEADDDEFLELLGRYREVGGLANRAEVDALTASRGRGTLAVPDDALAFLWHGTWWVPLFQFCLRDMRYKPGFQEVLAELAPVFDRVSLARWFLQSNGCLNGRVPARVIDVDPAGVLAAARLDRFVAAG